MRAPADVKCTCAASQQQHLAAAISNREELRWREATNQQQQNRDSTAPVPVSRHGERRHPPHNMQYRQQTSGHKGERPPPAGRCCPSLARRKSSTPSTDSGYAGGSAGLLRAHHTARATPHQYGRPTRPRRQRRRCPHTCQGGARQPAPGGQGHQAVDRPR